MTPALMQSLLRTLGLDPNVIAAHVADIARIAQSIDARLERIETLAATTERRACLIEARVDQLAALMLAEPGKPIGRKPNGTGKPLSEYIEAHRGEDHVGRNDERGD